MSWFNTLLDVTNLAMNVSNYTQLQDLRQQGAAAAMVQAILSTMRNQIFKFKQAAEDILADGTQTTKVKAGAMLWLEEQLKESRITPDLFPDLGDKDYVASTLRMIRTNGNQLMNQLSAEEQTEVRQFLTATKAYENYSYYLENYDKAQEYERALDDISEFGWRNNWLAKLGLVIGIFVIYGFLADLFSPMGPVGIWFTLIGLVISGVFIVLWQGGQRYKNAKKTAKELENEIDHELIEQIDNKVNQDHKIAFERKFKAKATMDNFLAGHQVSQAQPRLSNFNTVEDFLAADSSGFSSGADDRAGTIFEASLASQEDDDLPEQEIAMLEEASDQPEKYPSSDPEPVYQLDPNRRDLQLPAPPTAKLVTFCSQCGHKYPQQAQFCPVCGNPISNN